MAELTVRTQPYEDWGAEEKRTEKGKGRIAKEWIWSWSSYLPGRTNKFYEITKEPVSYDLWPRPWP